MKSYNWRYFYLPQLQGMYNNKTHFNIILPFMIGQIKLNVDFMFFILPFPGLYAEDPQYVS